MSRSTLVWLISVPLVIVLGIAISYSAPPVRERDQHYELVRLLVDVLNEVDESYVRDLSPAARRKLVEDMINGGIERLDPHSEFMNAQEFKQFERKSKGKFGGVGIQVSVDRVTGLLTITMPIAGSPAHAAGIVPGDQIIKVDGQAVDALRNSEIVDLIQGEPGTTVTLTIQRDGQTKPFEVALIRAIIEVETVLGHRRQPDHSKEWDYVIDPVNRIGYVRLIEFDEPTAPKLQSVLERLELEGVRGLVLDVRGNPGGLLTSAVAIADMFLQSGRIVSTRGRRQPERNYDAKATGTLFEPPDQHPIAVLIDRTSASASEIVAAALQDHDRAVVVGERSFGKGSVQNVFALEDHTTALKITTQSYWRPNGKNIHRFPDSRDADEWGVHPNPGFEVKLTDEQRLALFQSRRKLDVVAAKPDEAKFTDPALEKALESVRKRLQH